MYPNKITNSEVQKFDTLSVSKLDGIRKKLDLELLRNHVYLKGFKTPIPVQLNCIFLSESQKAELFTKSRLVIKAISKIVDEYFKSNSLQNIIAIDPFERDLLLNSSRPNGFGAMRLDAFWDGKGFKFVELNSDYPEGVVIFQNMCDTYDTVMHDFKLLDDKYLCKINNKELFYNNAIALYCLNGGEKDSPTIAVIGPKDRLFITEYELLVEFFQEKGHKSFLAEPKEITLKKDGYLYYHQDKIDIIRRAGEIRYFKTEKEASKIFESYRQGKITIINSFHDRLWGIKSIFAVLENRDFQHLFSSEEKKAIKETIPGTYILPEVSDQVLENKDNYVLKPSDLSEGEEIIFGKDLTSDEWRKLLADNKKTGWIVQELINLLKRKIMNAEGGKKIVKKLYTDFMIHTFMDKKGEIIFGNIGNRTSESPVVNVAKGGGINQVKIA